MAVPVVLQGLHLGVAYKGHFPSVAILWFARLLNSCSSCHLRTSRFPLVLPTVFLMDVVYPAICEGQLVVQCLVEVESSYSLLRSVDSLAISGTRPNKFVLRVSTCQKSLQSRLIPSLIRISTGHTGLPFTIDSIYYLLSKGRSGIHVALNLQSLHQLRDCLSTLPAVWSKIN